MIPEKIVFRVDMTPEDFRTFVFCFDLLEQVVKDKSMSKYVEDLKMINRVEYLSFIESIKLTLFNAHYSQVTIKNLQYPDSQ